MLPAMAQRMLSLDSCRALAIRNNKQLRVANLKKEVAYNTRKAVRTKYLPKVDLVGGYEYVSKEISLLSDDQKNALNNIGTNLSAGAGSGITNALASMAQQGLITPQQAAGLGQMAGQMAGSITEALNNAGRAVTDAFRTDNRNMFAASVLVRQPIYMGGGVTAANKVADLNETLAANSAEASLQNVIFDIDKTYWTVVSLSHKEKLAKSFLSLVQKLDGDVQKMIDAGVATRADGLKVKVKVNEAEMSLLQAEDGSALAKMLLCQQCGMPIDEEIAVDDNLKLGNVEYLVSENAVETALEMRPELRMLQTAVDISKETTRLARATTLPQVALTGGYLMTNPNIYNGYENRFSGVWNVGLLVRVPVWNWFEGAYKVRAGKAASAIASMELSEAQEMVELQVNQNKFKLKEAQKKLAIAGNNIERAEENLRSADLGFKEGVMQTSDVMAAQTAWLQAKSQQIDAEIELKMAQTGLEKALGQLTVNY